MLPAARRKVKDENLTRRQALAGCGSPARAGMLAHIYGQTRRVCPITPKTRIGTTMRRSVTAFGHWIPAFAGMTPGRVSASWRDIVDQAKAVPKTFRTAVCLRRDNSGR